MFWSFYINLSDNFDLTEVLLSVLMSKKLSKQPTVFHQIYYLLPQSIHLTSKIVDFCA